MLHNQSVKIAFSIGKEAIAEHGYKLAVVANGISCRHQMRDYFGETLRVQYFVQAVEFG